jgi:DNA replication protein DnaC
MRLAEMEMIDRERRMVERRIKTAKSPTVKSLDSFDFLALPSLNKMQVLELARSDYVLRRENIIAVGNSGTGKSLSRSGSAWPPARRACRSALSRRRLSSMS